jgi:hypothetical protein
MNWGVMRRVVRVSLVFLVLFGLLGCANAAMADGITNSGDDLRTGWYPNAQITPEVVGSGTFGQLWSTPVTGQVYAQPLVATKPDGSAESVIVTTEEDNVYALNPTTGAPQWTVNLGTPWNPADIGCGDIQPYRGSTSTPVIDPTTNTVYLTHKTYDASGNAEWFMDALQIGGSDPGAELPGFPVQLSGNADNFPSLAFDAKTEDQRPGLLLMNGVVYAAFGGNCDITPWQGWIFGVSASSGQITARWADNPEGDGAGIWQSGVGLTSDGPGTLLFVTGNGGSPTVPASTSSIPDSFGESVARLNVGTGGTLSAVDFFAPFDDTQLDSYDADFGAGALVGLPPAYFGVGTSTPNLGVVVGKEGYVYLLNLQNLGGFEQGPGGGDDVVQRLGPFGGVWGRAGVWPGDGGYIYIPTSTGESAGGLFDAYKYGVTGGGAPSLSAVGSASSTFGWGSGSPVITSDGTTSGSALVWIIWSANRTGSGAQLQAYNPVPVGGTLTEVYHASIGTSTNYSMPGVGNNGDLYVGTRGGTVLAFGSPVTQPVSGSSLSFPATPTGTSSDPKTLTLTANEPVDITGISSSSSQFTTGTPSTALPASLAAEGDTISIPITFSPSAIGPAGGNLTVTTDSGTVSIPVSGTGESPSPELIGNIPLLSLGGTTVDNTLNGTVTFTNVGDAPLTISNVVLPSPPFTASGAPSVGEQLAANQSVTIEINFTPTTVGQFSDSIELDDSADGERVTIGLAGSASLPGMLQISSENVDFGNVEVGTTVSRTFTLANVGGSDVTINKSKPPFGDEFTATSALPEGTTLPPGQTPLTETVAFTPTAVGAATGDWQITGDDGSGLHQIDFTGTGVAAPGTTGTTTTTTPASTTTTTSPTPTTTTPVTVTRAVKTPRAPTVSPSVLRSAALPQAYISYTALLKRTSHFTLARAVEGRHSAGRCVATTTRNKHLSRCVRWVTVAKFTHTDRVGLNRLRLIALVSPTRLTPATYRLGSVLDASNGDPHAFITQLTIKPSA